MQTKLAAFAKALCPCCGVLLDKSELCGWPCECHRRASDLFGCRRCADHCLHVPAAMKLTGT
jgi:hypothetical protein